MDSLKRVLNALLALEGTTLDASKEAYALLEDGASAGGPPKANQVVSKALAVETTIGLPLHARWSSLTIPGAHRARLHDRLMLGSYVKQMEWGCPSMD